MCAVAAAIVYRLYKNAESLSIDQGRRLRHPTKGQHVGDLEKLAKSQQLLLFFKVSTISTNILNKATALMLDIILMYSRLDFQGPQFLA